VLASYGAKADAMGVTLERRVPHALPALLGDELQLEVVLRNLVANALEAAAARDGRRVVCVEVLRDRSGEVKTTVEDSGGGVAAGDVQRIFEPFETNRATGMGMGLAISRAIVEAHGGRLWAEPGARGVFSFTLPAAEVP
jgi:signal transduction histidine kinase